MQVKINDIVVKDRIRRPDEVQIDEGFVRSIKTSGVAVPLLVRPDKTGRFVLVAGLRRLMHAKAAGLSAVPVYVLDGDDPVSLEILENSNRAGWTAIHLARIFKDQIEKGMQQADVCLWWEAMTGESISTSKVSQYLKCLRLPAEVQQLIVERVLDFSGAREIGRVCDLEDEESADGRGLLAELLLELQERRDAGSPMSCRAIKRWIDLRTSDVRERREDESLGAVAAAYGDGEAAGVIPVASDEVGYLLLQVSAALDLLQGVSDPRMGELLTKLASFIASQEQGQEAPLP